MLLLGKCSKKFPKEYADHTSMNFNGYPLYRRRRGTQAHVRGTTMDNRNVVPYNAFLLVKYDAHINVEASFSVKSIKYIYKYIFKGFDCANVVVTSEGTSELQLDEVSNFVNCRYLSAPEAMWRLLEFKMHDRSHAVIRLPVHLPNQQSITFLAGQEEQALQAAATG